MRGKEHRSWPQQSMHTRLHLVDASQGKQGINQSESCGQATSSRQQEADFTLNRWIEAAKINSKAKLILGLRKSAMPARVPGPEQAPSEHCWVCNEWVRGGRREAGVNHSRGLRPPWGWDCSRPQRALATVTGATHSCLSRKAELLLCRQQVCNCLANLGAQTVVATSVH